MAISTDCTASNYLQRAPSPSRLADVHGALNNLFEANQVLDNGVFDARDDNRHRRALLRRPPT